MGFLTGDAPSTTIIPANETIAPPDYYESSLYDQLGNQSLLGMQDVTELQAKSGGLYDTAMQNMLKYQTDFRNMNYDGQLNPMMAGQLQEMLQNQMGNIDQYTEQGMGGLLNGMANRGVVNSSATGRAFGDLGANANTLKNDAMNNYMNQYMQQYGNQYDANMNKFMQQYGMNLDPYSLNQQRSDSLYGDAFNVWDTARNDRYGLENDMVTTEGTDGALIPLASTAMMAMALSDERLKENVVELREADGSLCKIDGHQMYTWDWNEKGLELLDTVEYKEGLGVIAQEVFETRPDAVVTDTDHGYMMVDYGKLFGGK